MKTYLGDMMAYIRQTETVLGQVVDQRSAVTQAFVEQFDLHQIESLHLTGAGTSCFSAQTVRRFMEMMLEIPVWVHLPMQFIDSVHVFDPRQALVGISATGTSVSTIQALDRARHEGMITFAATAEPDQPAAQHADVVIPLLYGEEDVAPKSKSYSTELVTLMLCAMEAARSAGRLKEQQYDALIARLQATIANVDDICASADDWFNHNVEMWGDTRRVLIIGCDDNLGNVQEGALKILETARIPVSWHELEEFMHGIYHSIDADCTIIYLVHDTDHAQRMLKLKEVLAERTSRQIIISHPDRCPADAYAFLYPFCDDPDFYPVEYILPLQVISYRLARLREIDPNRPSDPQFHQKMNSKVL